jgi:hypothetical protein
MCVALEPHKASLEMSGMPGPNMSYGQSWMLFMGVQRWCQSQKHPSNESQPTVAGLEATLADLWNEDPITGHSPHVQARSTSAT